MRIFCEKLIIVSFCLYNSYKINLQENLVVYFLISIVISLALDLLNNKKNKIDYLFYIYNNLLF